MKEKFSLQNKKDDSYVLKFEADWCMPCKMMKPIVKELEQEFSNIDFYTINTEEDSTLVEYFGIQGVPTFVFVKEGKEVGRITGATNKAKLLDELRKIL